MRAPASKGKRFVRLGPEPRLELLDARLAPGALAVDSPWKAQASFPIDTYCIWPELLPALERRVNSHPRPPSAIGVWLRLRVALETVQTESGPLRRNPVSLRVIGAGLGRTGTHSLKLALEHLTGAPCYHMLEVLRQPAHIAIWQRAVAGEPPGWEELLGDYQATVDWPAAAFWKELSRAYPDALVLLSVREVDEWWASADRTIFAVSRRELPPDPVFSSQLQMTKSLLQSRFTPGWGDERTAKQAYLRHNDEVRTSVGPDRLLEWRPGEGWEPICTRLGLAVPREPFPHVNTTAEFRAFTGLRAIP